MVSRPQEWSRRAILRTGLIGAGLAQWSAASANSLLAAPDAIRLKLDAIGKTVEAETRSGRATGVSISVAEKGVIIWEGGFGVAQKRAAIRATASTPFCLASITKTFTVAAVMRLVQAGTLSLDAPINRYLRSPLPRSRFDTKAVTLRLLGGHAGGLPSLFGMFEHGRPAAAIADLIRDYGELAYPAGERYEYANLGYSLLGAAISHVTGEPFPASLDALVIRPLSLRNSFFDTDSARMRGAAGRYDQNGDAIPFYTTATPPSGELYASAHDLSIFAANMMGIGGQGRLPLLSPEARDELFSPVLTSRTKAFTTFGWSGRDVAGERMIVKTGGQPGVAARLTLLPTRKISIAVIANRDDNRALVAEITSQIASAIMSDWSNPDFRMDDVPQADAGAQDYDGLWSGLARQGDRSEKIRILIKANGASTCTIGNGGARPILEMANRSPVLTFSVDGDLFAAAQADGAVSKLDFKLIARNQDLVGRCLAVQERPGLASTEPHIITLSRSP